MAIATRPRSAAQIEAEIEAKRHDVSTTISQIQNRLSVGQLIEEGVGYVKQSGGPDFVGNLGRSVQNNPLPVALIGAGLAWLMFRPNGADLARPEGRDWEDHEEGLGYAPIRGHALRRISLVQDESGRYVSTFVDESGTPYKAWSDEAGRRAGHFVDEIGRTYRGFTDEAGRKVTEFLDVAGNKLDEALGWASDDWLEPEETEEPGLGRITGGSLRRLARRRDATGRHMAEFADSAGSRFHAFTDEGGNRSSHFRDSAGGTFRGFTDETGRRVTEFRDEAGNLIEDAAGWASDTVGGMGRQLREAGRSLTRHARGMARGMGHMASGIGDNVGGMRDGLFGRASAMQRRAADGGGRMQGRAGEWGRSVSRMFEDQPLVGGALAFALGAMVAAALPKTETEDRLMGEHSDQLKNYAAGEAHEAYESGREQMGQVYQEVRDRAADTYGKLKSDASQTATH